MSTSAMRRVSGSQGASLLSPLTSSDLLQHGAEIRQFNLHIQVNFTYVKIEGHVSNDLSGDTSDCTIIAWVQNFPRAKLE